MSDEAEDNGTQTLESDAEDDFENQHNFNLDVFRNTSVTFTSSSSLFFRFWGHNLSSIAFHVLGQRGALVVDLPVVQRTDTVGYVTSPRFGLLTSCDDLFTPNVYHVYLCFTGRCRVTTCSRPTCTTCISASLAVVV